MKCPFALDPIAARYRLAMPAGYQNNWTTAFLTRGDSAPHSVAPDYRRQLEREELGMTTLSKTLIAAAAFAAIATTAFSQVPWEFNPGMAYMYSGPGKMMSLAMESGAKNHEAMMKHATKVPNTVFFMDQGELYSTSGTLDPTGNFYRP
jgi:hypothetical protein